MEGPKGKIKDVEERLHGGHSSRIGILPINTSGSSWAKGKLRELDEPVREVIPDEIINKLGTLMELISLEEMMMLLEHLMESGDDESFRQGHRFQFHRCEEMSHWA